jgi:hypothetical protein
MERRVQQVHGDSQMLRSLSLVASCISENGIGGEDTQKINVSSVDPNGR